MGKRLRRLGAIAQAVYNGNKKGIVVGHTLLQKLIYFLQYAKGVDLGYRYRLYHYGPYCQEVWGDLSYLEDINAANVTASPTGFGYHIYPEAEIQEVMHFADSEIKAKVSELLDFLGHRPVRELECLATTHYVYKELQDTGKDPAPLREAIKNGVLALKPYLSESDVWTALQALQEKGLL